MSTFRNRTRRGAAILFSGVLVLGGVALSGEASAVRNIDDNPTCEYLGYTHGAKWDNEPPAGTYTLNRDGMEASLTVGTYPDVELPKVPNENNAITAYQVSTAGEYAIVVKGGDGATVYGSGAKVPLHAPAVSSDKWPTISHFDLCWNGPPTQPDVGQLKVTKVVLGTDTPDDFTFEICVAPVAEGDEVCKDIEGNGTVTFGNLPVGDYVVTETDPGPRFSVKGSGVTVTVKLEDTTEATVTNTWIPPSTEFGRVEVTKTVNGDGAPTDGPYEICLTGPDPLATKVCKTVVGEGTVTFEDLVPGIYTVTETDPGTEYEVTITPATVEVAIGKVATATVTNEYTEQESLPPTVPVIPEVLPPTVPVTPEVLPPTVPVTPEVLPVTPAAPATPSNVASQTALPTTGSEGGIAVIATILVAAGVVLTLVGRRREPQQA